MAKFVTGRFKNRADAGTAGRKRGDWGYRPEDVSVLMAASTRRRRGRSDSR